MTTPENPTNDPAAGWMRADSRAWARCQQLTMVATDVVSELKRSGGVDLPPTPDDAERSRILAAAVVDLSRATVVFAAWAEGVDLVALEAHLPTVSLWKRPENDRC